MARVITKDLAVKIAKKLKAEISTAGKAHDIAAIYHNGVLVASFGIRRGSDGDQDHDYVPGEIFVGPSFAKLLGQCPKSREDWVRKLQEAGHIAPDP